MDIGTAEVALIFSGVVCVIGVLNFRGASKAREVAAMRDEHAKELETREWRTEARGMMSRQGDDIKTVKTEQREMRAEVRENADQIKALSSRHDADVARLSGRIEAVDGRVGDLMVVMKEEADMDSDERKEKR